MRGREFIGGRILVPEGTGVNDQEESYNPFVLRSPLVNHPYV